MLLFKILIIYTLCVKSLPHYIWEVLPLQFIMLFIIRIFFLLKFINVIYYCHFFFIFACCNYYLTQFDVKVSTFEHPRCSASKRIDKQKILLIDFYIVIWISVNLYYNIYIFFLIFTAQFCLIQIKNYRFFFNINLNITNCESTHWCAQLGAFWDIRMRFDIFLLFRLISFYYLNISLSKVIYLIKGFFRLTIGSLGFFSSLIEPQPLWTR